MDIFSVFYCYDLLIRDNANKKELYTKIQDNIIDRVFSQDYFIKSKIINLGGHRQWQE